LHPKIMQGKKEEPQNACGFKESGKQVLCPHFEKKKVVPILKIGKDPKNSASYRPISLTSTMGQSMERIINTRLNWLLETNNIIANEQARFRIHRSTSERIATFSKFIKDVLENKRISTAVFVDFKSAYES